MSEVYNTVVTVVDLITADSPEEAVRKLEGRLREAGFDPYEGMPYPEGYEQAFVSKE
jgi:hypothetical protein